MRREPIAGEARAHRRHRRARTRIPTSRSAGRWRPTRRCGATSRTPTAAASAIRWSIVLAEGPAPRAASCATSSATPATWRRRCSTSSASSRRQTINGVAADADRGRELRRAASQRRRAAAQARRNTSRCSAIAACGRTAGRPSPSIRRARAFDDGPVGAVPSRPGLLRDRRPRRQGPERLKAMIEHWWQAGRAHKVLPLDDRFGPRFADNAARFHGPRKPSSSMPAWAMCRPTWRPTCAAAAIRSRPMRDRRRHAEGVLIAHGDMTSGYSLYVQDGRLVLRPEYRRRASHRRAPTAGARAATAGSASACAASRAPTSAPC